MSYDNKLFLLAGPFLDESFFKTLFFGQHFCHRGFSMACKQSSCTLFSLFVVPARAVCSAHSCHHMHRAVVKGVMVRAVQTTVCFVLLHQYYLELDLHVQGEEELSQFICSCLAFLLLLNLLLCL